MTLLRDAKEECHLSRGSVFVSAIMATLLLPARPAIASAELARAKYCMNCHGFGARIVGPGYREIAARRAGEWNAQELLAGCIQRGSAGEWGPVAMPANSVSDEDALVLARWILSLEPQRPEFPASDSGRGRRLSISKRAPALHGRRRSVEGPHTRISNSEDGGASPQCKTPPRERGSKAVTRWITPPTGSTPCRRDPALV